LYLIPFSTPQLEWVSVLQVVHPLPIIAMTNQLFKLRITLFMVSHQSQTVLRVEKEDTAMTLQKLVIWLFKLSQVQPIMLIQQRFLILHITI